MFIETKHKIESIVVKKIAESYDKIMIRNFEHPTDIILS